MSGLANPDSSGRELRLPSAPKLPKKPAKEKQAAVAEPKGRRTWRDVVLWSVLALLAVAAVAEFRAQAAYRKALGTCNAALERIEGKTPAEAKKVTFDELKGSLPADPVYTKTVHSFAQSGEYTWTWQGVRRYKVHLFVSPKDGTVQDVTSEP